MNQVAFPAVMPSTTPNYTVTGPYRTKSSVILLSMCISEYHGIYKCQLVRACPSLAHWDGKPWVASYTKATLTPLLSHNYYVLGTPPCPIARYITPVHPVGPA